MSHNNMNHKLPFVLTRYQLQIIYVRALDGTLLPVSVIGNGTPVLMLHAFGMDARQFLPFIFPLTQQYTFYLLHFRGFGLAADLIVPQFDFIEQYARDTEQVLQYITALTNTSAIPVAGISMGALVMWAYFKHHGSAKVSQYLNIDQAPIIHNQADWQGGLFGEQQISLFDKLKNLVDNVRPYLNVDSFGHLPYRLKVDLLDMERIFSRLSIGRHYPQLLATALSYNAPHQIAIYQHSTWQHKLRCLDAYMQLPYDYRDALEIVDIPTTLLIGGRSQLYDPKWQQRLVNMLPNATAQILLKSGHAVPIDAPFGFYKSLKAFLQS